MRIFLFTIFVICSFVVQSQTSIDTIFLNLKSGAILVRLKTHDKTLKALKGKNDQLAEKIIRERDQRNQEIIEAFKGFTFCRVYYFYSSDSKQIKEKNFKGALRDEYLQPLLEIPDLLNNYLIAEFSETNEESKKIENDNSTQGKENDVNKRNEEKVETEYNDYNYSGVMESGVDALVLLSPELVQLQSPYPYYARTYENFFLIKKTFAETVLKLQYKIVKFMETRHPKKRAK